MSDLPHSGVKTVTDVSTWRRMRTVGELVTLPGCGHVARLIRLSLTALVGDRRPSAPVLSADLMRLLAGRRSADDAQALEHYQRNTRAFLEVAALCLVEPRLVLDRTPGEGEIGPDDLTDMDYLWIYYSWVQGTYEDTLLYRVSNDSP